jgi:hypothetical protein
MHVVKGGLVECQQYANVYLEEIKYQL